jgi:hypothetical protein
MKQLLSGLICMALCMSWTARAQSDIGPIQGWKMNANGGHYSYTPSSLIGSIPINYDIYPPADIKAEGLGGWLQNVVQKDLAGLHYTPLPGKPNEQDFNSIKLYSVGVKDASGKQWLVNYMAYTRSDGQVRYGRIIESPVNSIKPYMTAAVRHFTAICKKEGGLPKAATASNDQPSVKPKTKPQDIGTPVTAPGQGLKPSDIRGIVIHQETGIGVGGMVIIVWRPYLLLKDGTCYKHCEVSPYDLDIAGSRQVEPKQWGVWTIEGKKMTVTMNDDHKPDIWDSHWQWARPAVKNEKIKGAYYTIGGGGNTALGGGSMVVSSSNITFNDKGQFTRLSTGGGSYSGATGSVTAYSNKEAAGTYILDGYSLELRYNNGNVVRQSFYFYPDSKEVFGLGDRDYVPAK